MREIRDWTLGLLIKEEDEEEGSSCWFCLQILLGLYALRFRGDVSRVEKGSLYLSSPVN